MSAVYGEPTASFRFFGVFHLRFCMLQHLYYFYTVFTVHIPYIDFWSKSQGTKFSLSMRDVQTGRLNTVSQLRRGCHKL